MMRGLPLLRSAIGAVLGPLMLLSGLAGLFFAKVQGAGGWMAILFGGLIVAGLIRSAYWMTQTPREAGVPRNITKGGADLD